MLRGGRAASSQGESCPASRRSSDAGISGEACQADVEQSISFLLKLHGAVQAHSAQLHNDNLALERQLRRLRQEAGQHGRSSSKAGQAQLAEPSVEDVPLPSFAKHLQRATPEDLLLQLKGLGGPRVGGRRQEA
mmetsp:Transcript_86735/g.245884  ORF Transcript_86735/g.245884 Transcript_86735/m.245884 type:complete len:134 (-) Transcript_86735:42-443(-)